MKNEEIRNKCRGSLIGGAVGDALGYAVEFSLLTTILRRYGQPGITRYELNCDGVAEISDDTQMSLFTAEGLLNAYLSDSKLDDGVISSIAHSYLAWYATQTQFQRHLPGSWLSDIKALWAQRAPGTTCMGSLSVLGQHQPKNNSKGCGGVMRVAPVGIFGAAHPEVMAYDDIAVYSGKTAMLTHGHPLSTYSSMALSIIVAHCIHHHTMDREAFRKIVYDLTFRTIRHNVDSSDKAIAELESLICNALRLAESDISDFDAIRQLGEGWVADETLAIAIYSVMRYIDDFEKCVVCAVNHDGDSDSTGAVAGNIIGAILGYDAIPDKYKTDLELHDVILSVADDLCGASPEHQMEMRYGR